jgi:hypothetical protein
MTRRRRLARESPYSADAFLDIICNLVYKYVGIVLIVLVLVAKQASLWPSLNSLRVGELPPEESDVAEAPAPQPPEAHAVEAPKMVRARETVNEGPDQEARAYEREIAQLRGRLLEQLRTLDIAKSQKAEVAQHQATVAAQEATVQRLATASSEKAASVQQALVQTEADAKPLKTRIDDLRQALKDLEAIPPERRALRFHPPISKPVNAGELFFECCDNRVTFIDLQELLDRVKIGLGSKTEALRTHWQLEEEVGPVGPYALRYKLVRQRSGGLDSVFGNQPPSKDQGFGYAVTEWEVVPVRKDRGETARVALTANSAFRRIVDSLDTDQAVLTFFVYEDSFATFRTLREYLSERGFLVAGRPLPKDAPIGGSPKGTKSRAQ